MLRWSVTQGHTPSKEQSEDLNPESRFQSQNIPHTVQAPGSIHDSLLWPSWHTLDVSLTPSEHWLHCLVVSICSFSSVFPTRWIGLLPQHPAQIKMLKVYLFVCVCVCVCVCFIWLYRAACRIVVSQAGIEPTPPAMEALSSKNWTTRELPRYVCWSALLSLTIFC